MNYPIGHDDAFAPPKDRNPKVWCLHCDRKYYAWEMVFEDRFGTEGLPLWWCKYKDCNGAGFNFDILDLEE